MIPGNLPASGSIRSEAEGVRAAIIARLSALYQPPTHQAIHGHADSGSGELHFMSQLAYQPRPLRQILQDAHLGYTSKAQPLLWFWERRADDAHQTRKDFHDNAGDFLRTHFSC